MSLVDKVTLGQVSLREIWLSPLYIMLQTLHTHPLMYNRRHINLIIDGITKEYVLAVGHKLKKKVETMTSPLLWNFTHCEIVVLY
jgi:hypothetical protein